jgi:tripartite-type tricarboxylate transporter receptor subunit TctC
MNPIGSDRYANDQPHPLRRRALKERAPPQDEAPRQFGDRHLDSLRTGLALAAALATLFTYEGNAQAPEPPYAGKQIRMVIANGAGGAYDAYARVLAMHLSRYIPGSPSIVDQNMPIAAGMQATNWAYAAAPRDGTVILATYNSLLAEPFYGNPAARYDPRKFEYIGSISKQQNICGTWYTNPVKTIAQAKEREVIVTATGSASDSAILPRILNAVLSTRFKVVLGYSSTGSRLAVERGEADGVCGLSWSTLKASTPHWVQNHLLNVLTQTGARPQADLPDVPLVVDLVSNPQDRQAIELLSFQQEMGRPFLMPPGTPKDMVMIVRRAFDATVRDPLFLADAERALLEVDPMTGETMEQLLKNAYAAPKAVLQRAVELHGAAVN